MQPYAVHGNPYPAAAEGQPVGAPGGYGSAGPYAGPSTYQGGASNPFGEAQALLHAMNPDEVEWGLTQPACELWLPVCSAAGLLQAVVRKCSASHARAALQMLSCVLCVQRTSRQSQRGSQCRRQATSASDGGSAGLQRSTCAVNLDSERLVTALHSSNCVSDVCIVC